MAPKLLKPVACLAAVLSLAMAPGVTADEPQPDPGYLNDQAFVPEFDAVCGVGQKLSDGCDAIRDRKIVDATAHPWRAIGRVNFASRSVRQHCTGTLVSDRVVLTAAHCLYSYARKQWIPPGSIIFVAGFQRGTGVAMSRGRHFILNGTEDVTSRDFHSSPDQDWALLVLEDPIGQQVGYLEVLETELTEHAADKIQLPGYSGLRPNVLSVAKDCGAPYDRKAPAMLMTCSAMSGDSGAPVLVAQENGQYAIAGVFSSIVGYKGGFVSLAVSASEFIEALQVH